MQGQESSEDEHAIVAGYSILQLKKWVEPKVHTLFYSL